MWNFFGNLLSPLEKKESASVLLSPDNRMMYSLHQRALGWDNIDKEVNAFLFWLIPQWAASFGDRYPKILEGYGSERHAEAGKFTHTLNTPEPACEWAFMFCFVFLSPEYRPALGTTRWSHGEQLSQKTGVWAPRQNNDTTWEAALSPETRTHRETEPVHRWPTETGPGSSRGRTCAYDFWPTCICSHMARITMC